MVGKVIYHVFPARMTHLSPQLISAFYKSFNGFKQIFIIYGNESDFGKYKLLKEVKESIFYVSSKEDFGKLVTRDKHILLHSLIPDICIYTFFHFYKNVSVVCWGSGIKLASFKNYIRYPFKFLLYHSFKQMITLMEPDKIYLQDKYFLRNIINQPYIGEREYELDKYIENRSLDKNAKSLKVVYIGNNSTCINSYLDLAENAISQHKNAINIQFMFNYDYCVDSPLVIKLKSICDLNFPTYSFNTELYNLSDYAGYIDKCDIYVCGEERQTGLAAIYTALRLGKKLYLNGNNYDWITSLGCIVHHTREIANISSDVFLSEDSESSIDHNRKIIERFESIEMKEVAWNKILSLI